MNEEDNEEFSGMEVTVKPTTSNKLATPAAIKVTYRCVCVCVYIFPHECVMFLR